MEQKSNHPLDLWTTKGQWNITTPNPNTGLITWHNHHWHTKQANLEDCHIAHGTWTPTATLHNTEWWQHTTNTRLTYLIHVSQAKNMNYHPRMHTSSIRVHYPNSKQPTEKRNVLCKGHSGQKTGDHMEYRHLVKHPKHKDTWSHFYGNEIGQLAQGMHRRVKGMNTIFFINKTDIPPNRQKDVMCVTTKKVSQNQAEKDSPWGATNKLPGLLWHAQGRPPHHQNPT